MSPPTNQEILLSNGSVEVAVVNMEERKRSSVIVVGAGFSGIATGCRLKQKLGFEDFVIYERSEMYGGTWWANQCEHTETSANTTCNANEAT